MNQHVAIDAGLATEAPQRKGQARFIGGGVFHSCCRDAGDRRPNIGPVPDP